MMHPSRHTAPATPLQPHHTAPHSTPPPAPAHRRTPMDDLDVDAASTASLQARLMTHVLQKGWQAGAVLGSLLLAPATEAYRTLVQKQPFDGLRAARTAGLSCVGGVGLTALLGLGKLTQVDRDGLADRVYRLHHNAGQTRTDAFAAAGSVGGLAAAALVLRGRHGARALHYLGLAGLGAAGGVVLHVVTRPPEQSAGPNKMVNELRSA